MARIGSGADIVRVASSTVALPTDFPNPRIPRAPYRPRPRNFTDQFESHILFYDAFWYGAGGRVLLVGPPPLNLMPDFEQAEFIARPSGAHLTPKLFVSRSTMTIELTGAPANTETIEMGFTGRDFSIPIQPSMAEQFAGTRLLTTMNRNNELDWIAFWARWHAGFHGVDAIILFDNGSTDYAVEDLERTLSEVPGLKKVAVVNWPHRFGATDRRVLFYPDWPHFLQISSMSVVLRRFAQKAAGYLNCDIDELAAPMEEGTLFDLAEKTETGMVRLNGQWVEPVRFQEAVMQASLDHRAFTHRRRDIRRDLVAPKWVLDPARDWLFDLGVHPYWHKLKGAEEGKGEAHPKARFWHFKGINTGWKRQRAGKGQPNPLLHEPDQDLIQAFARLENTPGGTTVGR